MHEQAIPSEAASSAEASPNTLIERPPPGLARGIVASPASTVIVLGALTGVLGLGVWLFMLRRARRRTRKDSASRR
jgi:hypothetical protein